MSQEQARLAQLYIDQKVSGVEQLADDYRSALALQLSHVATDSTIAAEVAKDATDQELVNARFVEQAVNLLPRQHDGALEIPNDPQAMSTGLYLQRVIHWNRWEQGGVPYYIVGQNGHRVLLVTPAQEADTNASASEMTEHNPSGPIMRGYAPYRKRNLVDLRKVMTEPVTDDEKKAFKQAYDLKTDSFKLMHGRTINATMYKFKGKSYDKLSSEDIEQYRVIEHLTDLAILFGTGRELIDLCKQWKVEIPTYLKQAVPDAKVLGQLATKLVALQK